MELVGEVRGCGGNWSVMAPVLAPVLAAAGRLEQDARDFWEAGIQFGSWEAGAPLWVRSRL